MCVCNFILYYIIDICIADGFWAAGTAKMQCCGSRVCVQGMGRETSDARLMGLLAIDICNIHIIFYFVTYIYIYIYIYTYIHSIIYTNNNNNNNSNDNIPIIPITWLVESPSLVASFSYFFQFGGSSPLTDLQSLIIELDDGKIETGKPYIWVCLKIVYP